MNKIEELQRKAIEILDAVKYLKQPYSLYSPIDYAMRQGGKRIRPLLTLMASEMFSGDQNKAIPSAIAIEILHNFTLLHDDIMDQSPLRRGVPTVYNKYDTNSAILSGDTMFALSYSYLLGSENCHIPSLTAALTSAAIEVCEGQALDMEFERRNDVNIEDYIKMIRLKTGVLLATALKLGAITADASPQDIIEIYNFGLNIGIAFQLQDDILDCWSNLEEFGKVTGTDIADNKKTFLYLKSLELASSSQREVLTKYFSSTSFDRAEKESVIKSIYEDLGLRELAKKEMDKYNSLAQACLERIDIASDKKIPLLTLSTQLLHRQT